MDISAAAAAVSAHATAKVQAEASVKVLKMALDMESQAALQLLEALPDIPAAPAVGSSAGGVINTWA